jgi:hypothetical protein
LSSSVSFAFEGIVYIGIFCNVFSSSVARIFLAFLLCFSSFVLLEALPDFFLDYVHLFHDMASEAYAVGCSVRCSLFVVCWVQLALGGYMYLEDEVEVGSHREY